MGFVWKIKQYAPPVTWPMAWSFYCSCDTECQKHQTIYVKHGTANNCRPGYSSFSITWGKLGYVIKLTKTRGNCWIQVHKPEKITLWTTHQQLRITTQKIKKVCKLQSISHAWYTSHTATDFTGIPVTNKTSISIFNNPVIFTSHTTWWHLVILHFQMSYGTMYQYQN